VRKVLKIWQEPTSLETPIGEEEARFRHAESRSGVRVVQSGASACGPVPSGRLRRSFRPITPKN
jgi:hypothetical protein